MSINPRRRRSLKKKIFLYFLLLLIAAAFVFFLNTYSTFGKPLYVNPLGKEDANKASVEKILKDKHILFTEIILSNDFYLVIIRDNGQVKFSRNKDINEQVSSLQKILNQLTIEGKLFKSIDFRFEEPIISF